MDDDLINKARAALMSRVSDPTSKSCNIVIPIPDHCAEKLIEIFGSIVKSDVYCTDTTNQKIND